MSTKISTGVVHTVPPDLRKMLLSAEVAHKTWEDITPLARNEWICWIISPKKLETRQAHIKLAETFLTAGKRRPCCFAGCSHR